MHHCDGQGGTLSSQLLVMAPAAGEIQGSNNLTGSYFSENYSSHPPASRGEALTEPEGGDKQEQGHIQTQTAAKLNCPAQLFSRKNYEMLGFCYRVLAHVLFASLKIHVMGWGDSSVRKGVQIGIGSPGPTYKG